MKRLYKKSGRRYRYFTAEELDLIKKKYPITGTKDLVGLINRSAESITAIARKLGLKFGRYWDEGMIEEFIRRYPAEGPSAALGTDLNKTDRAMRSLANRLGLTAPPMPRKNCSGRYSNTFKGFVSPSGNTRYDIPATVITEIRHGLNRGKRMLDFNIDEKYLHDALVSQRGLCRFTGEPVSFADGTASVDRIDSSIGYVKGNVQITTNLSNLAKGNRSDEDIIQWCYRVVNYQNSKNEVAKSLDS